MARTSVPDESPEVVGTLLKGACAVVAGVVVGRYLLSKPTVPQSAFTAPGTDLVTPTSGASCASCAVEPVSVESSSVGVVTLLRLLALLRAMHWAFWTTHWKVQGDPFYGDHLLFDKLYAGLVDEIDTLAEKIVGLYPILRRECLGIHAEGEAPLRIFLTRF